MNGLSQVITGVEYNCTAVTLGANHHLPTVIVKVVVRVAMPVRSGYLSAEELQMNFNYVKLSNYSSFGKNFNLVAKTRIPRFGSKFRGPPRKTVGSKFPPLPHLFPFCSSSGWAGDPSVYFS